MFSLILYVLVIGRVSAIQLALRDHQSTNARVDGDCSSYTVIIPSVIDAQLHLPDHCLEYVIDESQKVDCDSKDFPMTCIFKLKKSANSTFLSTLLSEASETTFASSGLSGASETTFASSGRRPLNAAEIETWASKAVAKSLIYSDTYCKPATVGKPGLKHMNCDMCWSWSVPRPCNCDCRGWNQVGTLCSQPCHVRGDYTFDSGAYCHKDCNRVGQVALTVGCGLGHDRVCVANSGACMQPLGSRVVDLVEVLVNCFPGAGTALKGAGKAIKLAVLEGVYNTRQIWYFARVRLRPLARQVVARVKNMKFITDAFKDYPSSSKDYILEKGALKFMTANLPKSDFGTIALEIAKLADPTGVVTLVAGWIPPSGCDKTAYCTLDSCEMNN